jgi:hypothetical protein
MKKPGQEPNWTHHEKTEMTRYYRLQVWDTGFLNSMQFPLLGVTLLLLPLLNILKQIASPIIRIKFAMSDIQRQVTMNTKHW